MELEIAIVSCSLKPNVDDLQMDFVIRNYKKIIKWSAKTILKNIYPGVHAF